MCEAAADVTLDFDGTECSEDAEVSTEYLDVDDDSQCNEESGTGEDPSTKSLSTSLALHKEASEMRFIALEQKKCAVEFWLSGKRKHLKLNTVRRRFRFVSSVSQLYRFKEQIRQVVALTSHKQFACSNDVGETSLAIADRVHWSTTSRMTRRFCSMRKCQVKAECQWQDGDCGESFSFHHRTSALSSVRYLAMKCF